MCLFQITELAGYTARVSGMFKVFNDVSHEQYVRNTVHTGGRVKHGHQKHIDKIAQNRQPAGKILHM